jgi:UDPglucose 6-dehydrogenase
MKIAMIGAGYVGLVSGACFSEFGVTVTCVDKDAEKIARLRAGEIPIFEPGLDDLVARNAQAGRLAFASDLPAAVAGADAVFIAVGTPSRRGDGHADLTYVYAAAREIAHALTGYAVVVTKSTVPVGTGREVARIIHETNPQADFDVVSNPEFLREGSAINDFMRPDRIVIGSDDPESTRLMRDLYAPFQRNHDRVIVMDARSAELTKYAANAMLATRISFMNEIANLAEKLGADIEHVRKGIGADPRIGYHFLYPGAGYGGSCFPKDVKALLHTAAEAGGSLPILEAVEETNARQKQVLGEKIAKRFGGTVRGRRVALWGLAFKPNTNDMREAPSRVLIDALLAGGATVRAYDPVAMDEAKHLYAGRAGIELADSPLAALDGADVLAIITEWTEFRSPDFDAIKARLKTPAIFDGRNLYDPEQVARHGLEYYPIGRKVRQRA